MTRTAGAVRGPEPVVRGQVVARLTRASAVRGRRTVVHRVDLDVRAGEVLAVAGPNGGGKSTLLALLAGDLPAASGTVEVLGRQVRDWTPADLGMRRSVLLQSNPVAFPFTVDEVVRMGRAPWHEATTAEQDDAAVERALRQVELTGLRHRPLPQLSGGEQARAALARVLAQDTPLILLDEPTAALDLSHADTALRHARLLAAGDGRAVVVVLHDLNLAAAHADRVALLSEGALVAAGTPAQVFTEPVLSRVYGADVEVLTHPRTGTPLVMTRH